MIRRARESLSVMLALFCASLGVACSCEETGIETLVPVIDVVPMVVDFQEGFVGTIAQRVVTVHNRGTGILAIDSATTAVAGDVFSVHAFEPPVRILAGSSEPMVLRARPSTTGAVRGELHIASNDPERPMVVVELLIRATAAPLCEDGNVCTEDWFDTDTASCRRRFLDGISCQPADRCIEGAICNKGVCVGTSKVCRDDSVCTRDLCRQTDGECRFLRDETACDDRNPCTVDGCDATGCTYDWVPNGTRCDDADACSTDDACLAGKCVGRNRQNGERCDDGNSCTTNDLCFAGRCIGESIIESKPEGEVVFEVPLTSWNEAFLHRREVSLTDDGTLHALDHLFLGEEIGLEHVVTTLLDCGTPGFAFSYRPPDAHVLVFAVRREMQLAPDNTLRIVVGVRERPEDGFLPRTTTYLVDRDGVVRMSRIQELGGETGRALLPDGSHIFARIWPHESAPIPPDVQPKQDLVVVREDRDGRPIWQHARSSGLWSEFLGVAGPRVLFWANGSWGALDFNTGQRVWESATPFIADEMALSTSLNLGIARVGYTPLFGVGLPTKLVGVEILEGREVFEFPTNADGSYIPISDPVIAADGRIIVLMQRSLVSGDSEHRTALPLGLNFVELDVRGQVISTTPLPYTFPPEWGTTRSRDASDDPSPTVADDGITYVGYGDQFWAIEPAGRIRWTLTSTMPDAFTGTVPLLRNDGVVFVSKGSRRIVAVRTNGGQMTSAGWASFRHDNRRTKYTP